MDVIDSSFSVDQRKVLLILQEVQSILVNIMFKKYPKNKLLPASGIACFALMFSFLIYSQNVIAGWSKSSVYDLIFLLGIGICFSLVGGIYAFYSWAFTTENFVEWYNDQNGDWRNYWKIFYPDAVLHWIVRINSPIFLLAGLGMVGSSLYFFFSPR